VAWLERFVVWRGSKIEILRHGRKESFMGSLEIDASVCFVELSP
jgi:hypothetical protein